MNVAQRVEAGGRAVRERTDLVPEVAVMLGSGLGDVAEGIETGGPEGGASLAYGELPGFPLSTAPGHAGRLVLGILEGRRVLAYRGRVHVYEGYSAAEVALPVRLAHALGARTLVVTNACGGLNPGWRAGDLMLQTDLINATGLSPLTGPNDTELGPRFPVMFDAYDASLAETARRVARRLDLELREGVYLGIAGPAYATRAELRAYRGWGADVIGMSTVLEVVAARHMGLRVLGLSAVTDMALPDRDDHADEAEVLAGAGATGTRLSRLLRGVLAEL